MKTLRTENNYNTDHTRFGGLIYLSDFDTEHRKKKNTNGSVIAGRILRDLNFDQRCRKNIENQIRNGR